MSGSPCCTRVIELMIQRFDDVFRGEPDGGAILLPQEPGSEPALKGVPTGHLIPLHTGLSYSAPVLRPLRTMTVTEHNRPPPRPVRPFSANMNAPPRRSESSTSLLTGVGQGGGSGANPLLRPSANPQKARPQRDRKSTRLNSSHRNTSRMPSSA